MQPPPPTVIAHGKLSFHVWFKFNRPRPNIKIAQSLRRFVQPVRSNPSTCFAFGALLGWLVRISLVRCERDTNASPEKFRHRTPSPYCYEFRSDNRLESVANAHTAADLHVHPVPLTALVSRAVSVANGLRDTAWLVSRNGNDSRRVPAKTTSRPPNQAAGFAASGKVLNLRIDSKCRTAVIFLTTAQNKFINCLRSNGADGNFRTTNRHYADKWLRKRVFFCSSEQGNPAYALKSAAR
jgi:hypothetical protein